MSRHSKKITWAELQSRLKLALTKTSSSMISCGDGLYLRIFPSKGKSSILWYFRKDGVIERFGDYPRLSLADAREMLRKRLETKNNKFQKPKEPLFGELAAEWLESKKGLVRFPNIRKSVDNLKPLYKTPVRSVTNVLVKEALLSQEITPYKLRETLATLCNIMDLGVENGIINTHSCGVLKKSQAFPKPKVTDGFKFVPWQSLGELFSRLESVPLLYKQYFLLLCLTCLRPGECRQMEFSWIDEKDKCILVPGSIMKIKRPKPFRVPLTPQIECLIKQIRERAGSCPFMFERRTGGAPIVERDLAVVFSTTCGDLAHPHGFRKTARSFFAEHGVSYEVAAMCLDHRLETGADAVYQKSDMLELRRAAMENYSKTVMSLLPKSFKKMLIE